MKHARNVETANLVFNTMVSDAVKAHFERGATFPDGVWVDMNTVIRRIYALTTARGSQVVEMLAESLVDLRQENRIAFDLKDPLNVYGIMWVHVNPPKEWRSPMAE